MGIYYYRMVYTKTTGSWHLPDSCCAGKSNLHNLQEYNLPFHLCRQWETSSTEKPNWSSVFWQHVSKKELLQGIWCNCPYLSDLYYTSWNKTGSQYAIFSFLLTAPAPNLLLFLFITPSQQWTAPIPILNHSVLVFLSPSPYINNQPQLLHRESVWPSGKALGW